MSEKDVFRVILFVKSALPLSVYELYTPKYDKTFHMRILLDGLKPPYPGDRILMTKKMGL